MSHLPVVQNTSCKAQPGLDALRIAPVDSNRNRTVQKLQTKRLATQHMRAAKLSTGSVDVRGGRVFDALTPEVQGVRVFDVRKGGQRYAFDERQVCFENTFGNFVPLAWIAPRPPLQADDPGDQIGFWGRVVSNFDGLGFTSGLTSNFSGSSTLTMPDPGVYGVRFAMQLDPLPSDSNFPETTFDLSFTVNFWSGVAIGPTATLLHQFPVSIPAGTQTLVGTVDQAISSLLGNSSLRVSVGGSFLPVLVPDGNYVTAAALDIALGTSLAAVFPTGAWIVSTNPTNLLTTIRSTFYDGWRLDTSLPSASVPNLASILGYSGGILTASFNGSTNELVSTNVASLPTAVQSPLLDVSTAFVCSLTPSTPLFVQIAGVTMAPQMSATLQNTSLSVSLNGTAYFLVTVPDGPYTDPDILASALQSSLIAQFGGTWTVVASVSNVVTIAHNAAFFLNTGAAGGTGLAAILGFPVPAIVGPTTSAMAPKAVQLPNGIWFPGNANIRISMLDAV